MLTDYNTIIKAFFSENSLDILFNPQISLNQNIVDTLNSFQIFPSGENEVIFSFKTSSHSDEFFTFKVTEDFNLTTDLNTLNTHFSLFKALNEINFTTLLEELKKQGIFSK